MKTTRILILSIAYVFILTFSFCSAVKKERDRFVLIETDLGNIKVRLYNETPLHRDNFVRLVEDGFFTGQSFHRVIKEFMIQAGNPATIISPGDGVIREIDYSIPAEFRPEFFHKKGALAAARTGDEVNPFQESSGSQFYIVQGKVLNDADFAEIEDRINRMRKQAIFFRNINLEKEKAFSEEEPLNYAEIQQAAMLKTEEDLKNFVPYIIPENHRLVYATAGGAPHLDGSYTVFGEVVEGFDVVDRIAIVPTDDSNKPLEDIRITMRMVRR